LTATILTVGVDPTTITTLRQVGIDRLVSLPAPTVEALASAGGDTMLIGEDLADPLELAQRAHSVDPDLSVVLICPGEREPTLRQELLFTPFVGDHVRVVAAGHPRLGETVIHSADATIARRRHRASLDHDLSALPAGPDWAIEAVQLVEPLLEQAPVGVVLLDDGDHVREWNRKVEEILGVPREQALRRVFTSFAGEASTAVSRLLHGHDVPQPLRIRERPPLHVRLTRAPLVPPGPSGTLVILEDVTATVMAEEERERAQEQLAIAQRLESLGTLAGGIAHDFNNLLAIIQGSADLALIDPSDRRGVTRALEDIITATERAADLTAAMLTFAGRDTAAPEPIPLDELVGEIVRLARASSKRSVTFDWEPGPEPVLVEADRRQLNQVVMNLVRNAADAIGEEPGCVRIRTSRAQAPASPIGPAALLEVVDDGAGMSEATRARIFDPFFTTKRTGRGLGLASALGIINKHSGWIECDSVTGRGTTFRVFLPSTTAKATTADDLEPVPEAPPAAILVIEDEVDVARIATAILERLGHRVRLADDGRRALELLEQSVPDLVLLDLCMPGLGGRETFLRIRERYTDLPVVLCSGYSEEEAEDLIGRGPTAFVKKPYSIAELKRAVDRMSRG